MGDTQKIVHKLYLIRHGETVDNVAGLYAGSRDSPLTNHGYNQATRLAHHFRDKGVVFTHIFSSDLSRAFRTAEAIRTAQPTSGSAVETASVKALREQDFGSYEGKSFNVRQGPEFESDPLFQEIESMAALSKRASSFIDERLNPVFSEAATTQQELCVAIVSHGMLLATLWRCMVRRQAPETVFLREHLRSLRSFPSIENLGGWGNTAYLALELIQFQSTTKSPDEADEAESETSDIVLPTSRGEPLLSSELSQGSEGKAPVRFRIYINAINSRDHLDGLKRTGGGVGSSKYEDGQKKLDSFFVKRNKDE